MRIANLNGRLVLLTTDGPLDIAIASSGKFSPLPDNIYSQWDTFASWASQYQPTLETETYPQSFGQLTSSPKQVFAVGLNYHDHAEESGLTAPTVPPVFTKFASSLTGPLGEIPVTGDTVDWEVELVVVIGRGGRNIPIATAWDHVAGLTAGQDISDRTVQIQPPSPQFSLGKSFKNFGPIGPVLVTPDEFADPNNLNVRCTVNGEERQNARTSSMIFSVADLIEHLSSVTEIYPGDLIFTGTPAGVGMGREPQLYLSPGDVVDTYIEGIGWMKHKMSEREAT